MKTSEWIILLSIIAMCFSIPVFFNIAMTDQQEEQNTQIEQYLDVSTQSAINSTSKDASVVFATEKERKTAISAFYDVFRVNTLLDGNRAFLANLQIPCIVLVDTDGYYLYYIREYKNEKHHRVSDNIISEKNTWSNLYDDRFLFQYYLDKQLTVYDQDTGKKYEGNWDSVAEQLKKAIPGLSEAITNADKNQTELHFLSAAETYEEEKGLVITNIMQEKIQYFINTKNTSLANMKSATYSYTMPAGFQSEVAKQITKPCVIAFAQWKQGRTLKGYVNTFALTASDQADQTSYVLTRDSEPNGTISYNYHQNNCDTIIVKNIIMHGSMAQCAQKGATPCKDCMLR